MASEIGTTCFSVALYKCLFILLFKIVVPCVNGNSTCNSRCEEVQERAGQVWPSMERNAVHRAALPSELGRNRLADSGGNQQLLRNRTRQAQKAANAAMGRAANGGVRPDPKEKDRRWEAPIWFHFARANCGAEIFVLPESRFQALKNIQGVPLPPILGNLPH